MSAQQDLIRRMFDEVVNLGKLDIIEDLFHEEFQSTTPQGTWDRDGFKAYVETWRTAFPDIHCECSDFIEEGNRIAWKVTFTGTNSGDFMGIPATGRSVTNDSLNIATFKDGKGWRHQVTMEDVKLMTQLGLIPEMPS
jgi:predicted ester cyclase